MIPDHPIKNLLTEVHWNQLQDHLYQLNNWRRGEVYRLLQIAIENKEKETMIQKFRDLKIGDYFRFVPGMAILEKTAEDKYKFTSTGEDVLLDCVDMDVVQMTKPPQRTKP